MTESQKTLPHEVDVRREGRFLPKTLDPVITMASVQRYVESERYRSRRALLWTTAVFTLVLLGVVAVFVAVGVVVMRNTRETTAVVDEVREQTIAQAAEVAAVSARVGQVQDTHRQIRAAVTASDSERQNESRLFKYDLERFGRWVNQTRTDDLDRLGTMQSQVRQLEERAARREEELALLRKQCADLVQEVELVRTAPPVPVPAPSARAPGEVSKTGPAVPEPPAGPSAPSRREIQVLTLPNGDRYEGEFRDGLFCGWGVFVYHNGDRYEGEFADDQKNGKGAYTYANGDKYVGEFQRDKRNGQGTFFFSNGDRYVGAFSDNAIEGAGTMSYQNGNRYAGDFRNGLKHGTGTFTYANGDRYTGAFEGDERNGQGTYEFKDGSKYIGAFRAGRRHGNGRYVYPTGEEYVGEFRDGKKDGIGTCVYLDGTKVKGQWRDDRFVGSVSG